MTSTGILASHIKKLGHPVVEIRERALQQLSAKLRLGWEVDDELTAARELLHRLLAWFHVETPSLQKEALKLLLSTIKSNAGTYIIREMGVKEVLDNLSSVKHKVHQDAIGLYEDVVNTLQFLGTVSSEVNVAVPRLSLPDSANSSENESGARQDAYIDNNILVTSKDTSLSSDGVERQLQTQNSLDGIRVLLLPWAELCSSDAKTLLLIEDALRLVKSTRRCCRFIRDVFLRDFPAEIFLNRPTIIQRLLALIDESGAGKSGEVIEVLQCITKALQRRILQLQHPDFISSPVSLNSSFQSDEELRINLDELAEELSAARVREGELSLETEALQQMPAPVYCLDALQVALTSMTRSVLLVDNEDPNELFDLGELTQCTTLVENLVDLLLECVGEEFWTVDLVPRTHKDIAHRGCLVMRLLGDLLDKYRSSYTSDVNRSAHRVSWLRLVGSGCRLVRWARRSALPAPSLAAAMQTALVDAPLALIYPGIYEDVAHVLQSSRLTMDKEFKRKYDELQKLLTNIKDTVIFMKNEHSCRDHKSVLAIIRGSLPALQLHNSEAYIYDINTILWNKLKDWKLDEADWSDARIITTTLMAHELEWVQVSAYKTMADTVIGILTGKNMQENDEKSLHLLFDVSVLTEICCHGLSSKIKEVYISASETLIYLLRGRLLMSEPCWWRFLASLLPVLPLLHCYAAHDTPLGEAICKCLEPEIAECMGISRSEVLAGLSRLLFVKCPTAQMEAAHAILKVIEDSRLLPPRSSLRADVLVSALRRVKRNDFNVETITNANDSTISTTGILQVLEVLKQDLVYEDEGIETYSGRRSPTLEPSLRRAALQQLAMLMQHSSTHETFIQNDGLNVVTAILRMSLLVEDCLAFPECALSCVSVLNSACATSRHALAKMPRLLPLLLRVPLVFPSDEYSTRMVAQLLVALGWAGFTLQQLDEERRRVLALPHCVTERVHVPFPHRSYWHTSTNATRSTVEWLLSDEDWRTCIRIRWACEWFGLRRIIHGEEPPPGTARVRPTQQDITGLQASCPLYSSSKGLLMLQNATTHRGVHNALAIIESYTHLVSLSSVNVDDYATLPWTDTLSRYLNSPPASPKDVNLLSRVLRFIIAYLDNLCKNRKVSQPASWILKLVIDKTEVMSLLKSQHMFPEQSLQEDIEVTQLQIHIVKVLLRCNVICGTGKDYNVAKWESLLKILLVCLERIDLKNFHLLGFLNELMRCVRYISNNDQCILSDQSTLEIMRVVIAVLQGIASGGGYKGQACRLDALLTLLAAIVQARQLQIPVQRWSECWVSQGGGVTVAAAACTPASRPELRAAALRTLAVLAHHTQLLPHLNQAVPDESLAKYASCTLAVEGEANVVRAGAAAVLASLAARTSPYTIVFDKEFLQHLQENNFLEVAISILTQFCSGKSKKNAIEGNVPRSVLDQRSQLEVRASKQPTWRVPRNRSTCVTTPAPSAVLVATLADLLYNLAANTSCPLQAWNERSLFRLLFRCTWWGDGEAAGCEVRARSRRALARIALACDNPRHSLASTADCLHAFLHALINTPDACLSEDIEGCDEVRSGFLLLSVLLQERAACASVWRALHSARAHRLFLLILHTLSAQNPDLRESAYYALSQLMNSLNTLQKSNLEESIYQNSIFDELKLQYEPNLKEVEKRRDNALCGGDCTIDSKDCQPEYLAEEICKELISQYQSVTSNCAVGELCQDGWWSSLVSCLCALVGGSVRARLYAVHRHLPASAVHTMQLVRNELTLHAIPPDAIRDCNTSPILMTLYWLLVLVDSCMCECDAAKESFAEHNIAYCLNKLWPWCMMTEPLREAVTYLLTTFTNRCPKAWTAMSQCVSGRCLAGELCAVAAKEMALQGRTRPARTLLNSLDALRHCVANQHCRSIVLKTELLVNLNKMHPGLRRARIDHSVDIAWEKLTEMVCRFPEGGAKLLESRSTSSALVALARAGRCLTALAHAAHFQRAKILQTPELLEAWGEALSRGELRCVVPAARALWALAANNHKAKLVLRTHGLTTTLGQCLQRLRLSSSRDANIERAIQLLTYTYAVMQVT